MVVLHSMDQTIIVYHFHINPSLKFHHARVMTKKLPLDPLPHNLNHIKKDFFIFIVFHWYITKELLALQLELYTNQIQS